MRTYWDLEEKTRAQLTEAEVERYGDFELMAKGVLKVKPLQLAEVPKMPEPDLEVHVLMADSFHSLEVAAAGPELLGDLVNAAWRISTEWIGGQRVEVARDIDDADAHVKLKRVYSAKMFAEARASIEKANAAKSANEKAEREHEAALVAQRDALSGLWSDWHECVAKHRRLGKLADTWAEYMKMAGDRTTATLFLGKAFALDEIVEAKEWFELDIPTDVLIGSEAPAPVRALAPAAQDSVDF